MNEYIKDANGFKDLLINKQIVELFLENGLNINHAYKSDSYKNALMKLPFQRANEYYLEEMTRFLLEKGANPNQQSVDGRTALHWAIRWANPSVAKVLIPVSDLKIKDHDGQTALAYARMRLKKIPMVWEKRALAQIIKLLK